jgi:hypothetical protein
VQELLADQVALGAGELREIGDLLGDPLLLLERQPHRLDHIGELGLRLGDAGDRNARVGVQQVLDDHHRVIPLLDRLPVEVRSEPRQRLRVVVDGDRNVLLGGRELVPDLLVQPVREGGHTATLTG